MVFCDVLDFFLRALFSDIFFNIAMKLILFKIVFVLCYSSINDDAVDADAEQIFPRAADTTTYITLIHFK